MKRVRVAAAMAVLGLVAAGCGGGDGDGESGSTAATTSPAAVTTTAPSSPTTDAVSPTTTADVGRPTVADVTLQGGSEPERYSYEVTYPDVAGLADPTVQKAVNDETRADVTAAIDEFVSGTDDFGPPLPELADQRSAFTGRYQLARLDDGLLSFRLPVSRFYTGQAHPARVLLTFTYDLGNGRRLALADLFLPGSPYLDRLSELSRQLLLAQPGFDQMPEFVTPGTEPKAENFANWTVTDQDLVITFNEYQVAPYAMGTPHVSIPFASLRTLLDPAGPLAIHN
ncbi:MAG TPA: RsiV family protein [Acidimicrobiales bacterium]